SGGGQRPAGPVRSPGDPTTGSPDGTAPLGHAPCPRSAPSSPPLLTGNLSHLGPVPPELHDGRGRVHLRRAGGRALKGAVAPPEAIVVVDGLPDGQGIHPPGLHQHPLRRRQGRDRKSVV